MKSGAPWHLKGVHPDARDSAREAARRAGMSVGQWLNSVILETVDEPDDDDAYDDPYAPPTLRRRPREERGDDDITAITDRIENLTDIIEGLSRVARPRHDDAESDATAHRLADAIAKLDHRVEHFIQEGRSATRALGLKVESVDRALSALGRERVNANTSDWATSVDQAVDEISQRQRELEREAAGPTLTNGRAQQTQSRDDLAAIHDRLRHVSEQVETFGSSRMSDAIDALRSDLADIAGKLTEASPRRAIEALESEVRLLASRLDVGGRSGNGADLSGIENGLADVREAIRALTPAESLSGAVDAIHVLSQKIDQMAAGAQDPAAMHQLEGAIAGLRGVVSRVASDDSLAALTAEVRTLSEKVSGGISGAASGNEILNSLQQRIGTIADAIESVRISAANAGTSALEASIKSLGEKIESMQAASDQHAGGADLGAMIGSLGDRIERMHAASDPLADNSPFVAMIESLTEKIERLQAARGDGDILRQIEQRVGALSDKLEASEAKLGNLDSIDRGMKELLTYLEGIRKSSAALPPQPAPSIVHDVLRTQDSLEAAHGTIGDVVDRLAMIETGMRGGGASPLAPPVQPSISGVYPTPRNPAVPPPAAPPPASASPRLPPAPQASAASKPATAQRPAIDDILPYDHPLEPGSGKPRPGLAAPAPSGAQGSPAERIAASRAIAEPSRTAPAEADPKPNFIVAARRAAQAAADDDSVLTSRTVTEAASDKASAAPAGGIGKHLKSIIVGASVIVIIAGAIHLLAGLFDSGDAPADVPRPQSKTSASPSEIGASGVLTSPSASGAAASSTAIPNAGILPQIEPTLSPQSAAPSQPAASPERTDAPPPVVAPTPDVTGALVPNAPATVPAQSAVLSAPAASGGASLPAAIGGKVLISAAESGDPAAAYEVATRYMDGRGVPLNPEVAATWFERAARAGLPPAMFRLGGLYEKGIGVKKDLIRARDLYIVAAERGNAKAMHNLAVLYADGFDGKPDYPSAIKWFRMAAARGVPDSQYNLGVLYARGIGVEQNFGESFRWFALAAQSGDQDAASKRDDVAKRLDPQTLSAVRATVQSWAPESQPDDAITVKTPPGGWEQGSPPAASKTKSKRVQSGGDATPL